MSAPAAVAMVGCAWRTALGDDVTDVMERVARGESAAAPLARVPADGYAIKTVAAIGKEPARSRHARFLRRMGLFAIECAAEAGRQAGVDPAGGPRAGFFAGVGGLRAHWDDIMAALANQRDDGDGAWARGLGAIHPFWMLRHLSNNAHALGATDLGLRGDGATFGGAHGGAQALAAAARALAARAIDVAVVVAYDSLLEPETLVELGARAPRCVPGEAAAAVVLVRPDAAPRNSRMKSRGGDPGSCTASVRVAAGADGERGEPRAETVERVVARVSGAMGERLARRDAGLPAALGELGAATAVVQVIAIAERLWREVAVTGVPAGAVAVATGAPGLASAVAVEVG